MNWRMYLRLIRWRFVFWDFGLPLPLAWSLSMLSGGVRQFARHSYLNVDGGGSIVRQAVNASCLIGSPAWFALVAFVLPSLLGLTLGNIVRTPLRLHCALLLPGMTRDLQRCHMVVVVLAALGCATLGVWVVPGTPAPIVFGCAIGLIAMAQVPASGRHVLAWLVVLLFLLVFAEEIREVMDMVPVVVVGAGLATAAMAWHKTFSREQLRANVLVPAVYLRANVAIVSVDQEALQKEFWRRRKRLGRSWTHGRIEDSTVSWLRALAYAYFGSISRTRIVAMILSAGSYCLLPGLMFGLTFARVEVGSRMSAATKMFYLFCAPGRIGEGDAGDLAAGFVAAFICLCALAAAGNFAEPVPAGHFYPISRARLGRVAYFNSLVKVGALVAVVLGLAAILVLVTGWLGGHSFAEVTPRRNLLLGIGLALPLVAVSQWAALMRQAGLRKVALVVAVLSAGLAVIVVVHWAPRLEGGVTLPALAFFLVALLGGQWSVYQTVLRGYRRSDLVRPALG